MAGHHGVSIPREIEIVRAAVGGIRVLSTELRLDHAAYPRDEAAMLEAIEGISLLVIERLRLLERAAADEINPSLLASPQNEVGGYRDVCLAPWSPQHRKEKAKAEQKRAKRELERGMGR